MYVGATKSSNAWYASWRLTPCQRVCCAVCGASGPSEKAHPWNFGACTLCVLALSLIFIDLTAPKKWETKSMGDREWCHVHVHTCLQRNMHSRNMSQIKSNTNKYTSNPIWSATRIFRASLWHRMFISSALVPTCLSANLNRLSLLLKLERRAVFVQELCLYQCLSYWIVI